MKTKRYIAYFLFFISLIVPAVPVVPHHHHANGAICMKSDITPDCCNQESQPHSAEHCCCDTGCVTTHFVPQAPDTHHQHLPSELLWVATLLYEPLFKLLALPACHHKGQPFIYQESLHSIFIVGATGLRAPPTLRA